MAFFLNDLHQNHLKDDGVVFLGFNPETSSSLFGCEDLHKLFDPFISSGRTAGITKSDIGRLV